MTDAPTNTPLREDEQALLLALFRFEVISPLLDEPDAAPARHAEIVREIAERHYHLPGRGPLKVSERTVYGWWKRYREGGFDALRPKKRKDRGTLRALEAETLERAIQLRTELPSRWTSTLLDILKREGKLVGKGPHRATLDRHLVRRGASRRQMRVLGEKRTIKMRFAEFGDLWVGDYHHGPLVRAPDGRVVTAKLGGIIDHCTRFPVADRYYLSEDLLTLRDCSLRAFLRFGLPKRFYTDRGAVYRAEQLSWSLARVGSHLIHSRAYYSQGRGVIERWWQCADAFENEVRVRDELLTIHELNSLWVAWRELRYCAQVHSDLGCTPNEAIAKVTPKPLDPTVADELFLVREDRTVHRKDGCVPVEGRRFLCESHLRGQEVQVRYDPRDLSSVLIFQDGLRIQKALPQPINATPEPHPEEPAKVSQSVDYLALLREDYDRRLLMQARPLAYADLRTDPTFDAGAFLGVLTGLAGLTLGPSEDKESRAFWDTYGPLPETLVRTAVEHAVRMHGRGRHVRLYLNAVQTLVLAHWRNPKEPS